MNTSLPVLDATFAQNREKIASKVWYTALAQSVPGVFVYLASAIRRTNCKAVFRDLKPLVNRAQNS